MVLNRLRKDSMGTSTVEFIVVSHVFFGLFFIFVGFALVFLNWKMAEKAAQLGARMAVVSTPAADGLPERNGKTPEAVFGQSCGVSPSPCIDFDPVECVGTACTGAGFTPVFDRMQMIFDRLEPENVRIRYEYAGLGYAGGPTIPVVSVTITGVDVPVVGALITGAFNLLSAFEPDAEDRTGPTVIPDIRATMTGEDLNTQGA